MELVVLQQENNKLVLEVRGEGHSLCNAIKEELWNDKNVVAAAYKLDHPLISKPHLIVETNGKITPKKAIVDAAKRLLSQSEKLKKEIIEKIK